MKNVMRAKRYLFLLLAWGAIWRDGVANVGLHPR